jgi:hypothetical protein
MRSCFHGWNKSRVLLWLLIVASAETWSKINEVACSTRPAMKTGEW